MRVGHPVISSLTARYQTLEAISDAKFIALTFGSISKYSVTDLVLNTIKFYTSVDYSYK